LDDEPHRPEELAAGRDRLAIAVNRVKKKTATFQWPPFCSPTAQAFSNDGPAAFEI
jgi:hypothetical protein